MKTNRKLTNILYCSTCVLIILTTLNILLMNDDEGI